MIDSTIQKIEEKITQSSKIDEVRKEELLELVNSLKGEVIELSKTHSEHARNITGLTETSTNEAIQDGGNPEMLDDSIKNLNSAVEEFEISHPKIVEVVNRICVMLSNSGI